MHNFSLSVIVSVFKIYLDVENYEFYFYFSY